MKKFLRKRLKKLIRNNKFLDKNNVLIKLLLSNK